MVDLRGQERKILSALSQLGGKAQLDQVIGESGLPNVAVMRAALALREKNLVKVLEEKQTIARLNEEGRIHAKKGLPERRLLNSLRELGGKAALEKVIERADLERKFVQIALGWAQRKKWAIFDSKVNTLQMLKPGDEGNDEKLLRTLNERGQILVSDLHGDFQDALQVLKRRKLLRVEEKIRRILEMTDAGRAATAKGAKAVEEVTQLTPELIITGKWRRVKLQKYNIEASVAKTWPGKKHPYLQFLEEVKEKLVTLGFKEMVGPTVETSFFNFDALYTPQDHPAREISGIYLVKTPVYGDLNPYRAILNNVKRVHEDGWKTGSTGWRYNYSTRAARRLILRGHGTCLSVRTLLSKDLVVPGRYFSIARCYRPEVVDKMHLPEFNQVEGIVVDEKLTLRDLLGVLEKFAVEIAGADKVMFKPDYFPFTEPSVELSAYKEGYGWIEFGGSGIFRPEVTLPLGVKVPVIAWGLGVDRLFMMRTGVDDIRYIFTQDLDWIRRRQVV
ncbi:MAG: phenylalanine--tRNA ligase subunit alpha [Candidatus Bathycorpusculaceae bacterium]